jgi:hypothetical protein
VFGISLALLTFAGGLIVGWFLLPAPRFIVNLWARLGLVDRVP